MQSKCIVYSRTPCGGHDYKGIIAADVRRYVKYHRSTVWCCTLDGGVVRTFASSSVRIGNMFDILTLCFQRALLALIRTYIMWRRRQVKSATPGILLGGVRWLTKRNCSDEQSCLLTAVGGNYSDSRVFLEIVYPDYLYRYILPLDV